MKGDFQFYIKHKISRNDSFEHFLFLVMNEQLIHGLERSLTNRKANIIER